MRFLILAACVALSTFQGSGLGLAGVRLDRTVLRPAGTVVQVACTTVPGMTATRRAESPLPRGEGRTTTGGPVRPE